ncbi:hypothetical protein ACNOYE_17795 [Nannocystaceae bacterium ST9]
MAASDLPEPAPDFDLPGFMGAWYILVSNYGFWHERTHPRIEYALLPDEGGPRRVSDQLRYRQLGLFGRRAKLLAGIDEVVRPGEFVWRGAGLLTIVRSRWCVPLIDPRGQWAITYFARSNIGTAPGLDLYTRAPSIDQATLDRVLDRVRAHPFLGGEEGGRRRCAGLFPTVQDWRPPKPWRL